MHVYAWTEPRNGHAILVLRCLCLSLFTHQGPWRTLCQALDIAYTDEASRKSHHIISLLVILWT